MTFLADVMSASGFEMLGFAATAVTATIATGQGGSFSTSIAAMDLLQKDYRRATGAGLDDETCTLELRASAAPSVPHTGWLVNVTSGNHQGKWSVGSIDPGGQTTGLYLLRCRKGGVRGTPT